MIGYWHDTAVCLSVCPSVCDEDCIVAKRYILYHRCDKRLQRLQKILCKRVYYFVNVYLNKNHMSETKQNYDGKPLRSNRSLIEFIGSTQLSLHVARPKIKVTEHLQTNDRPNIQTYALCTFTFSLQTFTIFS